MRLAIALLTYVLIGMLRVWLYDLTYVNHSNCDKRANKSILALILIWPLSVPLNGVTQILWISMSIFIVWVSFLSSRSYFLAILVATILGSLVYAFWGENVKNQMRLSPEERDRPLHSRIFLRSYRIFILIVIPGLPIYFITLKIIGLINWSWWWVLSPFLIFMITIILILFGAAISTRKEEKKILKTRMGIYKHNVTGRYYIIEKTCDGKVISGFGPIGQWEPESLDRTKEMIENEELHSELDELLIKYSEGKETHPEFTDWLKSQQFTLCYEKRPSTEESIMDKTEENDPEDKPEAVES